MRKHSLDQLTGKLAIGALVISALALIVQRFTDIIPFTEELSSRPIWDVFLALPFLFLSYLTGLIVVRLSSVLFDSLRKETVEQRVAQMIKIGVVNNEFITDRYEQLLQDVELLQATCPAVALLGIAIFLGLRIAPGFPHAKLIFGLVAFLLIACVPLLLFLISKMRSEMVELSKQTRKLEVQKK